MRSGWASGGRGWEVRVSCYGRRGAEALGFSGTQDDRPSRRSAELPSPQALQKGTEARSNNKMQGRSPGVPGSRKNAPAPSGTAPACWPAAAGTGAGWPGGAGGSSTGSRRIHSRQQSSTARISASGRGSNSMRCGTTGAGNRVSQSAVSCGHRQSLTLLLKGAAAGAGRARLRAGLAAGCFAAARVERALS